MEETPVGLRVIMTPPPQRHQTEMYERMLSSDDPFHRTPDDPLQTPGAKKKGRNTPGRRIPALRKSADAGSNQTCTGTMARPAAALNPGAS